MNIQSNRSYIVPGHFPLPLSTEELVSRLEHELPHSLSDKDHCVKLFRKLRENKLQPEIGLELSQSTHRELLAGNDVKKIAALLSDPLIVFALSTWDVSANRRGVMATTSLNSNPVEIKLEDYKRAFMLTLLTLMQVGMFSQLGYLGAQQSSTVKILSDINNQNIEPVTQSVIRIALDLWGKVNEARWQHHMNAFVEFFGGEEALLREFAHGVSTRICTNYRNAVANFSASKETGPASPVPSREGERWRARMKRWGSSVSGLLTSSAVSPPMETPPSNPILVKGRKAAGKLLQYTPAEGYFCKNPHRMLGYSHAVLVLDGIVKFRKETEPQGMEEGIAWAQGVVGKTLLPD